MSLVRLQVTNVRNLTRLDLLPSPQLNVIHGDNGSGKTSLLDAIHILSTGRSFLNDAIRPVIQYGKEALTVFGEVADADGRITSIGLERQAGCSRIRINGRTPESLGELLEVMPVQYLGPDSQKLLEQGPRERRRLLDWGVFHVEHGFYPQWRRYQRALRQRNAALKAGDQSGSLKAWDQELVGAALHLHQYRAVYMEALLPCFTDCLHEVMSQDVAISARYSPGWNPEHLYADVLARSLERDLRLGFTHYGPHRADLVFKVDEHPASEALSRGQLKLVVVALKLAQVRLLQRLQGRACVFLMDDLPSELDQANRGKVLRALLESGAQPFVTCTDPGALRLDEAALPGRKKMFHVEHGCISEVI